MKEFCKAQASAAECGLTSSLSIQDLLLCSTFILFYDKTSVWEGGIAVREHASRAESLRFESDSMP